MGDCLKAKKGGGWKGLITGQIRKSITLSITRNNRQVKAPLKKAESLPVASQGPEAAVDAKRHTWMMPNGTKGSFATTLPSNSGWSNVD